MGGAVLPRCKLSTGDSGCAVLVQKYLSRMIKAALICGLFAAIFRGQSNNSNTLHKIYEYIIKVNICNSQSFCDYK